MSPFEQIANEIFEIKLQEMHQKIGKMGQVQNRSSQGMKVIAQNWTILCRTGRPFQKGYHLLSFKISRPESVL